MNIPKWIRPLFFVAGLYDGILGILFWAVPLQLFEAYGVTPPNHIGCVQFPAALLFIFALMFFNIARNPISNRNLIIYGVLLKVSYCGVIFYYRLLNMIPSMWVPYAYIDIVFMIAFIWASMAIRKLQSE